MEQVEMSNIYIDVNNGSEKCTEKNTAAKHLYVFLQTRYYERNASELLAPRQVK